MIGPELRRYIFTSNDEERPFNRDQRRWVYGSAKRRNNHFGFGSDNDMESMPNYLIISTRPFPSTRGGTIPAIPCPAPRRWVLIANGAPPSAGHSAKRPN